MPQTWAPAWTHHPQRSPTSQILPTPVNSLVTPSLTLAHPYCSHWDQCPASHHPRAQIRPVIFPSNIHLTHGPWDWPKERLLARPGVSYELLRTDGRGLAQDSERGWSGQYPRNVDLTIQHCFQEAVLRGTELSTARGPWAPSHTRGSASSYGNRKDPGVKAVEQLG